MRQHSSGVATGGNTQNLHSRKSRASCNTSRINSNCNLVPESNPYPTPRNTPGSSRSSSRSQSHQNPSGVVSSSSSRRKLVSKKSNNNNTNTNLNTTNNPSSRVTPSNSNYSYNNSNNTTTNFSCRRSKTKCSKNYSISRLNSNCNSTHNLKNVSNSNSSNNNNNFPSTPHSHSRSNSNSNYNEEEKEEKVFELTINRPATCAPPLPFSMSRSGSRSRSNKTFKTSVDQNLSSHKVQSHPPASVIQYQLRKKLMEENMKLVQSLSLLPKSPAQTEADNWNVIRRNQDIITNVFGEDVFEVGIRIPKNKHNINWDDLLDAATISVPKPSSTTLPRRSCTSTASSIKSCHARSKKYHSSRSDYHQQQQEKLLQSKYQNLLSIVKRSPSSRLSLNINSFVDDTPLSLSSSTGAGTGSASGTGLGSKKRHRHRNRKCKSDDEDYLFDSDQDLDDDLDPFSFHNQKNQTPTLSLEENFIVGTHYERPLKEIHNWVSQQDQNAESSFSLKFSPSKVRSSTKQHLPGITISRTDTPISSNNTTNNNNNVAKPKSLRRARSKISTHSFPSTSCKRSQNQKPSEHERREDLDQGNKISKENMENRDVSSIFTRSKTKTSQAQNGKKSSTSVKTKVKGRSSRSNFSNTVPISKKIKNPNYDHYNNDDNYESRAGNLDTSSFTLDDDEISREHSEFNIADLLSQEKSELDLNSNSNSKTPIKNKAYSSSSTTMTMPTTNLKNPEENLNLIKKEFSTTCKINTTTTTTTGAVQTLITKSPAAEENTKTVGSGASLLLQDSSTNVDIEAGHEKKRSYANNQNNPTSIPKSNSSSFWDFENVLRWTENRKTSGSTLSKSANLDLGLKVGEKDSIFSLTNTANVSPSQSSNFSDQSELNRDLFTESEIFLMSAIKTFSSKSEKYSLPSHINKFCEELKGADDKGKCGKKPELENYKKVGQNCTTDETSYPFLSHTTESQTEYQTQSEKPVYQNDGNRIKIPFTRKNGNENNNNTSIFQHSSNSPSKTNLSFNLEGKKSSSTLQDQILLDKNDNNNSSGALPFTRPVFLMKNGAQSQGQLQGQGSEKKTIPPPLTGTTPPNMSSTLLETPQKQKQGVHSTKHGNQNKLTSRSSTGNVHPDFHKRFGQPTNNNCNTNTTSVESSRSYHCVEKKGNLIIVDEEMDNIPIQNKLSRLKSKSTSKWIELNRDNSNSQSNTNTSTNTTATNSNNNFSKNSRKSKFPKRRVSFSDPIALYKMLPREFDNFDQQHNNHHHHHNHQFQNDFPQSVSARNINFRYPNQQHPDSNEEFPFVLDNT